MIVDNKQKKGNPRNQSVAILTIAYVVISLFSAFMISGNFSLPELRSPTAMVTAEIRFCLNHPLYATHNCNDTARWTEPYSCNILWEDEDGLPSFVHDSPVFNISSNGTINFTPSLSDVGDYFITINVNDTTTCINGNVTLFLNLTVTDCIQPEWGAFKNNRSTNLSLFSCWRNLTNITLSDGIYGEARFTQTGINLNNQNISKALSFEKNSITLNSSSLPALNGTAYVTLYNITMEDPIVFFDGSPCPADRCGVIVYEGNITSPDDATFLVGHFTSYYLLDSANLNLRDDSDDYVRYNNNTIMFYADYSYKNSTPVVDGRCVFRAKINTTYLEAKNMSYNSSYQEYVYDRQFDAPGNYDWWVTCNRTDYYSLDEFDEVVVTNRAPVLLSTIPNETWLEDESVTGRKLDDYFIDPDGFNLSYNTTPVPNIAVGISSASHVVTLTPERDFYGVRNVIYTAKDPHGGSAESNLVTLTVVEVEEPAPTQSIGGGGGGGGAIPRNRCEEYWICEDWTACFPTGIRIRNCVDLTECGTETDKPTTTENCTYLPTCFDNIKNHGETGVDCGGPCKPCPTCFDGIQNQGETGTDCGGPCKEACPTCFDGIQNQGETGTDCGGPCKKECEKVSGLELPFTRQSSAPWIILILLVLPIILFVARTKIKEEANKLKYAIKSRIRFLMTPKVMRPENLVEDTITKLESLEDRIEETPSTKSIEDIVTLMRQYISTLLSTGYSFTIEELESELQKHRTPKRLSSEILRFFRQLEQARFRGDLLTHEKIISMTKQAKALAAKIGEHKTDLTGTVAKNSAREIYRSAVKALKQKDIGSAKELYVRLLEAYSVLDEEHKAAIYKKIKQLHSDISKASEEK